MVRKRKKLTTLRSIGKAAEKDFKLLGINWVDELVGRDGLSLYNELCQKTGTRHDPCVLDVFRCAVAQAENPELPAEQRDWWYWSAIRKGQK